MVLSYDLYQCGFYEYIFKLKQYLSNCGMNRTTQLYGTCWFNTTINGIIFGSKMRGRFIQLLLHYKNKISEKDFNTIIHNINTHKYDLDQNINRNEQSQNEILYFRNTLKLFIFFQVLRLRNLLF